MTDTPERECLLNLAAWIERRKDDVGPYADHIVHSVKAYEAEIKRLRASPAAVTVKPLRWINKNEKHGYPDQAVDCLGGQWSRWFVDGQEYFKAPGDKWGGQGCADDEHERRIRSQVNVTPAPVAGWRSMESAPDWEGFGRALMTDWPTGDIEGSQMFDLSLEFGLIKEIPGGYDPDQHEDVEGICPDAGDPWYEYAFGPEQTPAPGEQPDAVQEAARADREQLAMQMGFAARDRHDVSEDALIWWHYTGEAKRNELLKMADAALRALSGEE